MPVKSAPLFTALEFERLALARNAGLAAVECSFDLQRSTEWAQLDAGHWVYRGTSLPYPGKWRERTIYYWDGAAYQPLQRFTQSLIKLVPTEWGAPTFEIDGIKMLPTSQLSPFVDAQRKVDLIEPEGKIILDTCGGLGYFAEWCRRRGADRIHSYEKSADVLWLRELNPWSPSPDSSLQVEHADVSVNIVDWPAASFDAVLHDPPRFGIAGELYSRDFYDQLARVLKDRGRLFHYTGNPNRLTSGRDVPQEVLGRLREVGFTAAKLGDGILASKGNVLHPGPARRTGPARSRPPPR